MQTNQNKEDKNIIERWDWHDFDGDYNPGSKKYYRKLRRRRLKQKFKKDIKEII